MKKTYKDVDSSLLNAIPNPDKKTYEIKIKQPELTFLGVYDQPDFASLYILFYPDKTIVELKSLKIIKLLFFFFSLINDAIPSFFSLLLSFLFLYASSPFGP